MLCFFEIWQRNKDQKKEEDCVSEKLICVTTSTKFPVPEKEINVTVNKGSGFGGLEDACKPLVPKFAGSNPA
jgi:hypothetical protein